MTATLSAQKQPARFLQESSRLASRALAADLEPIHRSLAALKESGGRIEGLRRIRSKLSEQARREPHRLARALAEAMLAQLFNGLLDADQSLEAAQGPPFLSPLSFHDAIASLQLKNLMPTALASAELRELDGAIRRQSFFSARVEQAQILQRMKDSLDAVLNKQQVERTDPATGQTFIVTEAASEGEARLAIQAILDETGYQTPGRPGTIEDLRTEARLNLILKTQTDMAYGFGQHKAGMQPHLLATWPCWELYRAGFSKVPRDWQERWTAAGGQFYDGRMIARKDDDVWQSLGAGAGGLGNPYPPFAFGSNMDVRPIRRDEAVELGVMEPQESIEPPERVEFGESAQADVSTLDDDLAGALAGFGYKLLKGILSARRGNEWESELAAAESEGEGEGKGVWRTIRGTPVFIEKGQSIGEAIERRFGKSKGSTEKQGEKKSESAKMAPVKERAWSGQVVQTKTKLGKIDSGNLGEQTVVRYLKSKGLKDARTLNVKGNNFPVDVVQDHEVIEVKTGLVSNGPSAQHWRATIGQPGPEETRMLKGMSKEEKARWNAKKMKAILARKEKARRQVGKKLGHQVKGKTMAVILNPDTKTADLYAFDGFHLRIPWKSEQARKGFVGTFKYD